jgi:preprotein translocase subunit SecD
MVHIPKWQVVLVLALLLCGLALAAPNLVSRKAAENIPGWLPHKQISLGLDLRGGSYLLLEAQLESVEQEHFGNLADSLRRELRKAKIGTTDLRVGPKGVSFTLRDPATRARAREIVGDLTNEFQVSMSDDGAVQLEFTELARGQLRSNVMDQTREILGIRIDETGVREPTIQRQGEERILIQLPGVDDPERMKEILGKTAKLTFRFVDENVTPGIDPTPRGAEVLQSYETDAAGDPVSAYVVRKRVMVGGENLVDARSTTDQNNRPAVFFRFDTVGGRRLTGRRSSSASIRLAAGVSRTRPRRTSAGSSPSCSTARWSARR